MTYNRNFIVSVAPSCVRIEETFENLKTVHAQAVADGVRLSYFCVITRPWKTKDVGKGWRGRAHNELFYHAKNQGEFVRWIPMSNRVYRRKKVPAQQMSLF